MNKKQNEIGKDNNRADHPKSDEQTMIDRPLWRANWWKALAIIALSIILYFQCGNFGYVLDDQIVITDNSFTKKGFGGIHELFTTESMTGYFGEQKNLVEGNRYRPLSLVTFAVEIGIVGEMNPTVSHWVNILLYGLTGVLLFRLLALLFLNHPKTEEHATGLAIGVATLFIAHPIHVEAVANIKGRDEIMALLFSLGALYYSYRSVHQHKWRNLIFANILFFLGLLSKENTITLLAIIPLTLYIFSSTSMIRALSNIWSFLVSSVLYLALRFSVSGIPKLGAESNDLMNNPFLEMDGGEKVATILYTMLMYIKLLIVPYPLTHDYYPYTIPIMDFGDWQVWASILVYGLLITLAFLWLKKRSIPSFGILFYLAAFTIVSNFVINLGTFMNDRFVYMSSVGSSILVGYLFYHFYRKNNRIIKNLSVSIFGLVVLIYAVLSFYRVPVWESALSLNRSAIEVSKNSARANTFMSTALFKEGLNTSNQQERLRIMNEAFPYAKKSVEIYPSYYNGNLMYAGIASELFKIDKNIDAFIPVFEKVMSIRPDISYLTDFLEYLNNRNTEQSKLNKMYQRVGQNLIRRNAQYDASWSVKYLLMAYAIDPDSKMTNQLLGQGYQMLGDVNRANTYFNRANTLQ